MPRKKKGRVKQSGEGVYDWVANNVFGANLRDGEIHAPQYTKDGWKFGSFIGPGSDAIGRIRDGVKPVGRSDKVAKAHDLRYGLAKTPADVRAADLRMIQKLNQIQKEGKDYRINTMMGKLPIKAKMLMEDLGIMKKGSFSDMKGFSNADDEKVARDELTKLDMKGYGKKKKPNAWTTHVSNVRAKNKGKSYKECLKLASESYKKN